MKKATLSLCVLGALAVHSCTKNPPHQPTDLISKVNVESTWKYLQEFQNIADKNNNNRSVGSTGGIASADYIFETLEKLGLTPSFQDFKNAKGKNGRNVIVEIKGKTDTVTMIGGHYDSVEFGPGINDNATGAAVILEIISQIKNQNVTPNNTLRFAFWDSEEETLGGSKYYVSQLSAADKQKLANYINVDMVGTKDPTILVLDGDGSSWDAQLKGLLESATTEEEKKSHQDIFDTLKKTYPAQAKGAEKLEKIYTDYLKDKNVKYKDDYLLSNNTDVFPFLGMTPTFGVVMTNEKEEPNGELLFAPCYHKLCDDIKNVDKTTLKLALESITHLIQEVAIK